MSGADSMSTRTRKLCAKHDLDVLIRESAPRVHNRRQRRDELDRYADYWSPYWRLITAVRANSQLLTPVSNRGRTNPDSFKCIIRACARMANYSQRWRGLPETWKAPAANPFVQFRSLVSHLFDQFPVPTFMADIWTYRCTADRPWEIELYLHLASGHSVRQFKLPLNYPVRITKRAAQWWMRAPDDILPIAAYRWAHVRALGGDSRLADILKMTPALIIPTEHEDFWESVIRFLIKHSPISASEICEIVDFIHAQRFQAAERTWGPGAGEQPLQPNFSLRGRSLMSLRRHMANWRVDLGENQPTFVAPSSKWTRTDIAPFRHEVGDTVWTIDELLTDHDLQVEGGMMNHCVATYVYRCARRRTSIWSMKMHQGERRVRTLTIEVLPNSRIINEARGKRNAPPKGVAKEMLNQWAEQEGLTFRNSA